MVRRRSTLVLAAVLCGVLALGVVVGRTAAGEGGGSSAPRARRAGWVTARVEERPLESVVVARGMFAVANKAVVVVPPKMEGAAMLAVTSAPVAVGSEVGGGSVVVEFNGRPVFVLAADIPIFQAIRPGGRGAQVVALQDGLAAAGRLEVGDERGVFGSRTQAAVDGLYRDAGYEPPYGAGSQAAYEQGIRDHAQKVEDARRAANLARATGQADPGSEAAYRQAVAERRAFIDSQGVMVTPDEIVTVPTLPLTLLRSDVKRGQVVEAGSAALTLGSRTAALDVGVSAAQVAELTGKVTVAVESEDGSYRGSCRYAKPTPTGPGQDPAATTTSTVQGDGAAPAAGDGTPSGEQADYSLRTGCEPSPPSALDGVGATVSLKVTASPKSLVVPSTAVAVDSAGRSWVTVVDRGRTYRVGVEVVADAGGYSALTATSARLRSGVEVRVRAR